MGHNGQSPPASSASALVRTPRTAEDCPQISGQKRPHAPAWNMVFLLLPPRPCLCAHHPLLKTASFTTQTLCELLAFHLYSNTCHTGPPSSGKGPPGCCWLRRQHQTSNQATTCLVACWPWPSTRAPPRSTRFPACHLGSHAATLLTGTEAGSPGRARRL